MTVQRHMTKVTKVTKRCVTKRCRDWYLCRDTSCPIYLAMQKEFEDLDLDDD